MKKSGKTIELKRTEKTIANLAQEIEDSKYRMGKTKANAYNTNMSTLTRIKKYKFANIPIEKVTKKQIEDFLQEERIKSNSTIKKDYRMLKYVYEYANYKLYLVNNFFEGINRIEMPKSLKEDKDVVALTITEQNKLEDYLETHTSNYKNIILLCLYSRNQGCAHNVSSIKRSQIIYQSFGLRHLPYIAIHPVFSIILRNSRFYTIPN